MRARTIIAAPVIWFGSWLLSLIGLLRMRCCQRLSCLVREIKKAPKRAHAHRLSCGWQLATPGGVPGYDGDKEFGNNITHGGGSASQRLREHSGQSPDVKAMRPFPRDFGSVAACPGFGER